METLLLATEMNQQCAVGRAQCAAAPALLRSANCAPRTRFVFVTCAVEIPGDTLLYSFTEAVDD